MPAKPTASIIILTYNNLELTRQCLESIYAKTDMPDFEVVAVDNASTDETPQYLQEFAESYPSLRVILNKANEGFARGNNIGAAAASGQYLVFLNNDVVVTKGWLSGLVHHLQDPEVGMVGPVTNSAGNESRIVVEYENLIGMEAFAERYTASHIGLAFEVPMLAFFCAAIRRQVFEEIGPLDEQFGLGMFEDDDYALRLKGKGYKCLCAEDVFIHHWGSAAWSNSGFQFYWKNFQHNLDLFEAKWQVKWEPPHYRAEYLAQQVDQNIREKIWLASAVLDRDEKIDQRGLEIAKRDRIIAQREETISQHNKQIFLQDNEIARLRNALMEIENSTSWKIIQASWRVRLWLAPRGSKRERLMRKILAALEGTLQRGRGASEPDSLNLRTGGGSYLLFKGQAELTQILSGVSSERPVIVFTPSINWNVPLFQRPQQMALAFARQGSLVIFCEPPESMEFTPGFHQMAPGLYVAAGLPFEVFGQISSPLVFVLAYNKKYLSYFSAPFVVYEYIDELKVFPGDVEILQREHEELVQSADLVLATAEKLLHHIQPSRSDVILCPNGVDYEFIHENIQVIHSPPEVLLKFVMDGRPIIGYYGAIAAWFDYNLLLQAAKGRPNYAFVLIGPDYDGSIEKSGIFGQKNITWLGTKPYAALPGYLKYFNVATIPFVLNEITHSTSPLKLYEYMSAGKPIVTTAMHECERYPVVIIARDAADYVAKLDQALHLQTDSEYLKRLDQTARENTWTERANTILAAYSSRKGTIK